MMKLRKKKPDTPLFGSGVPQSCAYCDHNLSPSGPTACRFGLRPPENAPCRRYRYNPLLRAPKPAPPLPEFDPEDFKL